MKSRLIPILIANAIGLPCALAQEAEGMKLTNSSVSVGVRADSITSSDKAKATEYRDLGSGLIGGFDIRGLGGSHYLNAFGENLGRDDQYVDLKGGKFGAFKYQAYENSTVHNWGFGMRTPYTNPGSSTLTGTFPNTNPAAWRTFDLRDKRTDLGGMLELGGSSPWYIRAQANEVTDKGNKLMAGPNGLSPGNGFIDKPFPLDMTTRNFSLEGGYATRTAQASLNASHSRFSNNTDLLRWQNPFFGGGPALLDTSTLPADNVQNKLGFNGVLKQLPMSSTLSGRFSYSKTTNNIPVLRNTLDTGATNPSTGADRTSFDGNILHKTASLSLHTNPTRELDSRVYWNWFRKENKSSIVTFTPAATTGLRCGGEACTTETLSYKKNNLGIDLGYRLNRANRVVAGFDYVNLDRNRADFDNTKDRKYSLEWRNTSLDTLSVRAKYQYLERRSNFLESNAGTNANDPEFLNRFSRKFDAANVDQDLVKLVLDYQPAPLWDLGFEGIVKQNRYKDTLIGRTKDERQEFYFSAGWGDMKKLRLLGFVDVEVAEYDAFHRTINTVAGTPAVCTGAAPNCFNPNTPPPAIANTNFNWGNKNVDKNWAIGLGADWLPKERWTLKGSATWQHTDGAADFSVQQTPLPLATPAIPIRYYDNTRKFALNLKAIHQYSKELDFTAGWAFERYRFSDIAYDNYKYQIAGGLTGTAPNFTNTSSSYLSGANAFPNYNFRAVYLLATYKFQ